GESFDNSNVLDVIPVFKHLQKNMKIILLADNATEGFLRQARAAGIFYHALEPNDAEDCQELKLALECAKQASEQKSSTLWKKLAPLFGAGHAAS
ncbi:MAG: response regulator receiver protein, partial [Desulfuromonas sp.]|nr:response regulator receiver protein [Desulfuromonas sp.]